MMRPAHRQIFITCAPGRLSAIGIASYGRLRGFRHRRRTFSGCRVPGHDLLQRLPADHIPITAVIVLRIAGMMDTFSDPNHQ